MGEYSREQRNQLSRTIANSETGSRQLKGFVDNRNTKLVTQQWTGSPSNHPVYQNSIFTSESTTKSRIYCLYTPDPQNPQNEVADYVGKTTQSLDERLKGHQANYPGKKIQLIAEGDWTPFETATYEQKWISRGGGVPILDNSINALDHEKWKWFHSPEHNINKHQASLGANDF